MNNCFALNRDALDDFEERLSCRIPGAIMTVFTYMLRRANYAPGMYQGVELQRGDVMAAKEFLVKKTGLKMKTVRNALSVLIGQGTVTERATKGASGQCVFHIVEYDRYDAMAEKGATKGASKGQARGKQGATEKEKEVKELEPKHMSANASAEGANAPPPDEFFPEARVEPKAKDVSEIGNYYNAKIKGTARLTDGAKRKILIRLNTYTKEELKQAIDKFAGNTWRMENNADKGMAWFFKSDDQTDTFLNLNNENGKAFSRSLTCPEHGPMVRSNVAGKITYFCKQFKSGCPGVYRSEVVWTDRLQTWEMKAKP